MNTTLNTKSVIENKKRTKLILIRIENTILNIVKGLYDNDELVIDVPNFSDLSKIPTKKTLRFNTKHRRNYLTIIIYMLSKIYKNLVSNTSCTARELYYGDTLLFKHDSILRKALINICYLLNTKSWELGITLTSKGLVAGNLIIYMHDGKIIDCSKTNEGIQIPQDVLEIEHFKSKAKYILIIEKNASFQKIINEGLLKRNKCSFIIITGKGFPDINTRLFVKQLSCKLNISVLVLVDANPFGIEIMCVYKFGSNTMSHQNDSLSVPMIQWLGVYPSEIASLNLPCISLTNLDQARIISLLKRSYINSNSKLLEQIRILHQLNKKAEIESLTTVTETYLTKLTSIKTLAGLHTNHSVNAYDLTKLKRNQKRRTCTK